MYGQKLRFNPKGKYVALGNYIRQVSQLEDLKRRIVESARKACLDEDFGVDMNIWVRLLPFAFFPLPLSVTTTADAVFRLVMFKHHAPPLNAQGGTSPYFTTRLTTMFPSVFAPQHSQVGSTDYYIYMSSTRSLFLHQKINIWSH